MIKLSVIIPCYNCASTLAEAVESVYRQEIAIPFEIILVDDVSTDHTWQVMTALKAIHPEISLYRHEYNQGGGATRNTAVEKSTGEIIFCLDSDDLLAPGTLGKMVAFWQDKKCDGVGISTSIKFKNKNLNDIAFTNHFGWVGEKIPFESLFEKKGQPLCPLYSTFLFTRQAFDKTGGYPTTHGFDTQGFAWRFLAKGLIAYTCPEAVYLHRINFHRSYYIREYEAGKINHNWYAILEEFLFLFNGEIKKVLTTFDLNNPTTNLMEWLNGQTDIFIPDYQKKLTSDNNDQEAKRIKDDPEADGYDYFWLGGYLASHHEPEQAVKYLLLAINKNLTIPRLYAKLFCLEAALGHQETPEILNQVIKELALTPQGRSAPFYQRVIRKLKRLVAGF